MAPCIGNGEKFVISAGDSCSVEGGCIRSPNYPSDYDSSDCTITVIGNQELILMANTFDTEAGYDYLTVGNGLFPEGAYDGNDGPNGVTVGPGEVISWNPDKSWHGGGWEVCEGGACYILKVTVWCECV